MQRRSLFCVFLLTTYCLLYSISVQAQENKTDSTHKAASDTTKPAINDSTKAVLDSPHATTDTTKPVSVDPELMILGNPKTPPREYTIGGIKIAGTKYLDESLLTSISGLTVGDKVTIPGGDNFSKAIQNLWKQNLFANVAIYFTKLVGSSVYVEIDVSERPRLGNFYFRGTGIKKGDADDL